WAGTGSQSPSAKYGTAFGVTGVEDGVSRYHGIDAQSSRKACTQDSECDPKFGESCSKRDGQTSGRCIPTWWGICHAWAPAAILMPEPKKAVTYGGVEFKVQDIKALLTLVFDRTETKFVSLRCDSLDSQNEIVFDKYGRPNGGASTNCRDTNPGTFHVLMTNYLGKQGEAFVYDRTWDGEVWNQPLRGYRITAMDEISALDANKLIGVTAEGGTTTDRNGTVVKDAFTQVGSFAVTAGQNVTVAMTGTGDADLYVKFGTAPSTSAYDCRPYDGTTAETCTLVAPAGATQVFVGVHGYAATSDYQLKITSGGSIPQNYVFNANAAKLYKVHMDVDYISESSASTDGNLGSTIDRYTHQDRYDYVLEIDSAGKIIGGEWVGTSKKQHPDFVWLPIRASASSVAGGKITYANVKMIYDLSMQEPGGGGTGGTVKDIKEVGTVVKSAWKQYGPFNVAAGTTLSATMTGDNDADLYVRKGAAPTSTSYDCRPYRDGSSESCSIVGPATVYVGVQGYAASSNFQLNVKYTEGGGTTPPTPPPAMFSHLNTNGSVGQGEMKIFPIEMPAGKKLVIRTTSTVDVDLYIQWGANPT
ncbi:MAG TPA: pre-peptidase C-terminal domain-containing protein, partial [Ilumatobacteraceae bacterium]|nr:pre-peptidase C-terminal domain-containing protein [Ilumatobacteraceae bacterium]